MLETEITVGNRVQVGGLGVFPLFGAPREEPAYLTGPEAFEAGLLELGELSPPEVPSLLATNLGTLPVLLVEGEVLVGGDQDRTMNVTVLCPPRSVIIVPVSCVEAGRWGTRRNVAGANRHAPGSLRSVKTATLHPRTADVADRRADQSRVWEEVSRQSAAHGIRSDTAALDDVHRQIEQRVTDDLDRLTPAPGQIGVACAVGDEVVGIDLFDRPATLARYLRGVVSGYAMDAPAGPPGPDAFRAINRLLAVIGETGAQTGPGVGLGEEVLLRGPEVVGIGLRYGGSVVHLAAFPTPAGVG
jgi:hypothetical protein